AVAPGLHVEQSDVEAGGVADELRARVHRDGDAIVGETDAAREEHLQVALRGAAAASAQPELEDASALEEELAPLRKELRKPRQVHDGIVDFGLGEIGI